jgi:hypothetical protein
MATFTTYAEIFTPDHPLAEKYEAGIKKSPGLLLADVLRNSGGAYATKVGLSNRFRDEVRRLGQASGDERLLDLAAQSEVTVSLEHLRYVDPAATRVVIGYRISYTPEDNQLLGRGGSGTGAQDTTGSGS